MKILTDEKLFELLDADFAWRRKELSFIVSSLYLAPPKNIDTYLRVGVTMLYAHWQGYISNSGNWYINYLKQKKLNYEDMTDNFITLALKQRLKSCGNTSKTIIHYEVVNILRNESLNAVDLPHKNGIETTSNLNYDILEDVLFTLGLNNSRYELKKHMINFTLLESRNKIVHGERYCIGKEEFFILHQDVLEMLEYFRDQIIDAVRNKSYLRNNRH
jgi:hypothetical protein|nr:MAE_28990/MAE_18760 family HEPN-like nuclease [Methanosarcina sp. DH2]